MAIETKTWPGQSFEARQAPAQAIYTRALWADQWELASGLHCEEAVWSVAPSISTASLVDDWGQIAGEHATSHAATARTTTLRDRYVKIVFNMELCDGSWTIMNWYGVCRLQEDTPLGQRWTCYGLEVLLAEHYVVNSWWRKSGEVPDQIERGLTFNRGGKPNASSDEWAGVYYFGSDPDTNEYWSTADCVAYLLKRQTPLDRFGEVKVPFRMTTAAPPGLPPTWDRPELPTHGLSTWELLGQLLPRQRLMGFYVWVDEESTPHDVVIAPFTFTRDAILVDVPGAQPIPANPDLYKLDFASSPETTYSLKISTIERFDQVVARGARRRACFSVSVTDANLEAGWTAAHETEYEDAASGAAAYAAAGVALRERMNNEVRAGVRLRDVFARFAIPRNWNGRAGNGQGGDQNAVFNVAGAGTISYPGRVYDLELELEATWPLLEGVDYADDTIRDGTADESDATGQELAMAVWWKIPNTSPQRWAPVDTLGKVADVEEEASTEQHAWSASVSVEPDSRAFRLDVFGAPQHVIAETDFTPLADCNDQDLGDNDWREMIATVSVPEDRYAEGLWPAAIDGNPDVARYKYIDAGDGYRLDCVNPGTIVDVDDDAALVESSGGYVRDDRAKLTAIARTSYAWYGQTRRVLTLETDWRIASIVRGDFITAIATTIADGDSDDDANEFYSSREVGSVVTELSITTPRLEPGLTAAPTLRIVTSAGELDALISGVDLDDQELPENVTTQMLLDQAEAASEAMRRGPKFGVER